jgi:hypothetical protein
VLVQPPGHGPEVSQHGAVCHEGEVERQVPGEGRGGDVGGGKGCSSLRRGTTAKDCADNGAPLSMSQVPHTTTTAMRVAAS